MTFFLCDTGEETDGPGTGGDSFSIWRSDNFIFFSQGDGLHSYQIEDAELKEFCDFLMRASIFKHYQEFHQESDEPYIALEDDDEGSRNLCIMGHRMVMIFNVKTEHLAKMAVFLRRQIKCT